MGKAAPEPADGQKALDRSVSYKDTTTRRVAVDKENGEFVVLDEHAPGKFHGHVREWNGTPEQQGLRDEMKNALVKNGDVNRKGKIL